MLPVFDLSIAEGRDAAEDRLERLRATVSLTGEQAAVVADVLAAVRERGDEAVVEFMRRWTDPGYEEARIRVSPAELAAAAAAVGEREPELMSAIDRAIDNVRAYQRHVLPAAVGEIDVAGARLGLRFTPVDSAGLCVPGGTAVLFSTLVMLAVPALVAGVPAERLSVISPPPTRGTAAAAAEGSGWGDISPIVLATAHRLGISRVYRIGGAQGVAALAYGTRRVEAVDLVAGPGNVYVQLAKAMLGGVAGTDNGFYGPSEIVTIADESARAEVIAADLIAQAEHDPGKCFLLSWSPALIDAVLGEIQRQLPGRDRRAAIERALNEASCAMRCRDRDEALDWANRLAAEHVNLAVADPGAMLEELRHAGEVFLGDGTPVAAGDYYAGPSHCLPTGTTARFAGGVSVYTFLKRTGTVAYPEGMPPRAVADVDMMARAEGLDGHAHSARCRGGAG